MIEIKTENNSITVNIELEKRVYAKDEIISFSNSQVRVMLTDLGHDLDLFEITQDGYASNRTEATLTSNWVFVKKSLQTSNVSDIIETKKEVKNDKPKPKPKSTTNRRASRPRKPKKTTD